MRAKRPVGFVAAGVLGVGLAVGGLAVWVVPAGASEPPPVIVHNPRSMVHLSPGASYTFKASALGATTVKWVVRAPDSSTFTLFNGTNATTKKGVLKSSFTFGPFTASEDGWEVGAAFINDPTGVPSGIQETDTTPGVVLLRKAPKG